MNINKLFILLTTLLLSSCNNSTFSASAIKKKKAAPQNNTEEVQIETSTDKPNSQDIPNVEAENESCFEEPIALPTELTQPVELYRWTATGSTASYTHSWASVAVGPLEGIGTSIIVSAFADHTKNYKIYAIEGKTGEQRWVGGADGGFWTSPALGDIDNDGQNEVVIAGYDGYVYALNGKDGTIKWKSEKPVEVSMSLLADAELYDLDQDGKIEVIVSDKIFHGADGKFILSIPGLPKYSSYLGGHTLYKTVGDVNSKKGLEVITYQGVYSYSGNTLELICTFPHKIHFFAYGKLRNDDKFVTIVGQNFDQYDKVLAYNGETCEQTMESSDLPIGEGGGAINLADFDGDRELEIGTAGAKGYVALDTDGTLMWLQPKISSFITASSTFDFNGDGKAEIVFGYDTDFWIINGETGDIIYEFPASSYTGYEYPVVVDIDGDGHANVVLVGSGGDYYGVRVFSAPENDWIGTRQIWNQYSYGVTNVGDNGELIGYSKNNIWKKWIKSEHLLGFRNNLPMRPRKQVCD